MALTDGDNQWEGKTEEGGVPEVQDGAGQPGVRSESCRARSAPDPVQYHVSCIMYHVSRAVVV